MVTNRGQARLPSSLLEEYKIGAGPHGGWNGAALLRREHQAVSSRSMQRFED
jgi:hypothetical protein